MPWNYQGDYVSTLAQARERAKIARDVDPFPDLAGGLLNSTHIAGYTQETAMVFPFDEKRIKTATYPARIGECVYYWNHTNPISVKPEKKELKCGETFSLKKFSLVFVETEEAFLLPHYIAARFNLQIEFVHKGLLLGTGPLIDPGFSGKLLIPLHNLTNNEYELSRGQELIWVEFTKTSSLAVWCDNVDLGQSKRRLAALETAAGFPKSFPESKRFLTADKYFEKARQNRSSPDEKDHQFAYPTIRHAIPEEIRSSTDNSKMALKEVQRLKKYGFFAGIVGGISVLIAMFGIFYNAMSLSSDLLSQRADIRERLTDLGSRDLPQLRAEVKELRDQIDKLMESSLNARVDGGLGMTPGESTLPATKPTAPEPAPLKPTTVPPAHP